MDISGVGSYTSANHPSLSNKVWLAEIMHVHALLDIGTLLTMQVQTLILIIHTEALTQDLLVPL